MSDNGADDTFDVFMSHSHADAEDVEELAHRLVDERGLRPWYDRWELVPGEPFQPAMAKGLRASRTCAVCLGKKPPEGWFGTEIQKALNRQQQREAEGRTFRVIP